MVEQTFQILGALAVLTAFTLAQLQRLHTTQPLYLVLNVAGSGVLAVLALLARQWGFLLLEGVWAVVSAWSLGVRLLRKS
jgi:hypothetical protein